MDEDKEHEVILFGRDISKIPCFRNSFLYGIGGGIGAGLTTFMFTSRPQLSSHVAMGSFSAVCLCYWFQCRYRFSQTRFELARIRAGLQHHVMHEGTAIQEEIDAGHAKDV